MRELVLAKREVVNTPGGYWIAAARPGAAHHAITGSVSTREPAAVRRFALLTDGASCVVDRYRLMSWGDLLDLAHTAGPHSVIDTARKAESEDPAGTTRPRLKLHDDATVAYGVITEEDPDA